MGDSVLHTESSDEDSDEASEADVVTRDIFSPASVIHDRIENFKKQLQDLSNGCHSEYMKRVAKLERAHRDAQETIRAWQDYEYRQVEEDHLAEREAALGEFEMKKEEVKEAMINDLNEKRKTNDLERQMMDLTGDTVDFKPRRPTLRPPKRGVTDVPAPPEKRRKPAAQLGLLYPVDEEDAMGDVSAIFKGKIPASLRSIAMTGMSSSSSPRHGSSATSSPAGGHSGEGVLIDVRLEDSRLYYDKKVFVRGQPVYLETRDGTRINGTIQSIGQSEFFVRRTTGDQSRMRIHQTVLMKGKYKIYKRGI